MSVQTLHGYQLSGQNVKLLHTVTQQPKTGFIKKKNYQHRNTDAHKSAENLLKNVVQTTLLKQ